MGLMTKIALHVPVRGYSYGGAMSDTDKVAELLRRFTPEQLAAAYLKASRERNEAQCELKATRTVSGLRDSLHELRHRYGV